MQHPDPDELVLLALLTSDDGSVEGADGSVVDHILDCPECASEVATLTRTVALARFEDDTEMPPPPTRVWDAIVAELDLAGAPTTGGSFGGSRAEVNGRPGVSLVDSRPVPVGTEPAEHRSGPIPEPAAQPAPSGRRPWLPRFAIPLAAALVGGLVGGSIVWAVSRSGSAGTTPPVTAQAALVPVPGGPGRAPEQGQAQLLNTPDGAQLRVSSSDLPGISGSYEVWLLGTDGKMVSLGVLNRGAGTFTVPAGISTHQYGTVDISDEPPDGNPAHSKVSVLRGSLT